MCQSLNCVQLFVTPWTVAHRLLCPWNSPGKNTGVGNHFLLHVIFPTQESNPGLPHCRQILYLLSRHGSPRILEWVAYPSSRGSFWPGNQTSVSCIAGGFFTSWATKKAPNSPWPTLTHILTLRPVPPHLVNDSPPIQLPNTEPTTHPRLFSCPYVQSIAESHWVCSPDL